MAIFEFSDSPEHQAILSAMRLAAAKFQLCALSGEEAVTLANKVLNAGIYAESLRELAVDTLPSSHFSTPLLRTFSELGVSIPDDEEAVLFVICNYSNRIAIGDIPPTDGLLRIDRAISGRCDWHCHISLSDYDSTLIEHRYDQLFWLIHRLDELRECGESAFEYRGQSSKDSVARFEQDIIRLAKDWVASDECSR